MNPPPPSDHDEERGGRIPSGTPASALPGNLSRYYEAKKSPPVAIPVPPGWKRLLLPERVVYFSPSGIRLKNLTDVRDYLTTEGTCKCGLSCGFLPDKIFDFDYKKQSEVVRYDTLLSSSSCQHSQDVAHVSAITSHLHCPQLSDEKKSKKKKKKKRLMSTSNGPGVHMEAEKQRINEIINEQKREYEDQMKLQGSHFVPAAEGPSKPSYRPESGDIQGNNKCVYIPASSHHQRQSLAPHTLVQGGFQVQASKPSMQILAQPHQQPVMQLVNTLNGPVLMPTMPLQSIQTHQQMTTATPQQQNTTTVQPIFASPLKKKAGGKKNKKVVLSPSPVLTPSPGQQQLVLSGGQSATPYTGMTPQNILMHPSNPLILHNGVLMQAPVHQQPTQQILYNHQFPPPESAPTLIQYSQGGGGVFASPPPSHQTYIMTNTGQLVPSNSSSSLLPSNMDMLNNNSNNSVSCISGVSSPFSSPAPSKTPSPPPLSPPKLTKEETIQFETAEQLEDAERKHQKSLMIHSFTKKSRKAAVLNRKSPPSKGSFLQSNLVDSSGLRATPPHAVSNDSTFDALVASVKNHPSYSKPPIKKPPSNRILFVDSDESEEFEEEDERRLAPSKKKTLDKKKRKKRNADDMIIVQRNNTITHSDGEDEYSLDDSGTSGNSSHNADDFKVGDLVWGPFGAFPSWPGKLIRGADEDQKVLICWFGSKTITEEDPTALKTLSEGFDAHHKERKKMRKSRKLNASLEKAIQEAMMELDNEESMRCS